MAALPSYKRGHVGQVRYIDHGMWRDCWFIVTAVPDPHGYCFKYKRSPYGAGVFTTRVMLEFCEPVRDRDVPDEVWAALAKWRLSQ